MKFNSELFGLTLRSENGIIDISMTYERVMTVHTKYAIILAAMQEGVFEFLLWQNRLLYISYF